MLKTGGLKYRLMFGMVWHYNLPYKHCGAYWHRQAQGVVMINKVNTGAERAKVKYKGVVLGFLGAAAAMVITIGFSAPAFATSVPANFPGNNGTSCNAWHGAPGGFGPDSPFYTVSGPQGGLGGYTFGQAQGVITGQGNSAYAASCNQ